MANTSSEPPKAREDIAIRGYSLKWLLGVLRRARILEEGVLRDVEVRAHQQRARLQLKKSKEPGLAEETTANKIEVSPAEILASMDLKDRAAQPLDEERIAEIVAQSAGLEYQRIEPLELDINLVTDTVSRPFALRHAILPLKQDENGLWIAVENPFDPELEENLQRLTKQKIKLVVSSKSSIVKALRNIYGFHKSVESAAMQARTEEEMADFEQLVTLRSVGEIESTDQHIVNAVDFLLQYAFDQRASDIHVEPRREDTQVRLRIDGVLHDVQTVPKRVHPALISRLKTMSRMDIAEKRRPQDGRIKMVLGSKEVELRVSSMPVAFGEKLVMRIFDPDVLLKDFNELGLEPEELMLFQEWISLPHGLVLITGPTGSGKTTTLYSTLMSLADERINVTTVEDPIEMITESFNQVAVQRKIDVTFASALRTILRQDPDVIMIGEIRDGETAEMAVQAALTGHLVFSTLHTNDTVGAVARLVDLGVPPFLLSSTLIGVMAQRLARKVCPDCRRQRPLDADEARLLGISEENLSTFLAVSEGLGCQTCRGTGYFGRQGFFELLNIDRTMAHRIAEGDNEAQLRATARGNGLRTLQEVAHLRLAQGHTSVNELLRVFGHSLF